MIISSDTNHITSLSLEYVGNDRRLDYETFGRANSDDNITQFALTNGYPILGLYGSYDDVGITSLGVLIMDLECSGTEVVEEEIEIRPSDDLDN